MRRNTKQRAALEQVFLQNDRPLAVDEILEHGSKLVKSLNKATVYRNLKILVGDGWLNRVFHPSLGTLYERAGKGHHHHFYCHACRRSFELPGCPLREDRLAPAGFTVEDHKVFLFGVCPSCGG